MIISIGILTLAAVLASGSLFAHRRVLTFIAVAGTMWQLGWLTLTLVDRTMFSGISSDPVFLIGSLILLAATATQYKKWQLPYSVAVGTGKRDAFILIPLALVLGAAFLITSYNGFQNLTWTSHGFYNGDTATLISLTQRAFSTNSLLHENPFAAGGYLEYPTLLHSGIATFFSSFDITLGWFQFLPVLTYAQILITIPLFFLLWDGITPEPEDEKKKWFGLSSRFLIYALQAFIVVYVLAASWDGYIYPQSHFFLTGIFMLSIALFRAGYPKKGMAQLPYTLPGYMSAIVLLFANAVTGTAAVAVSLVFAGMRAFDTTRSTKERQLFIGAILLMLLAFFTATPGNANFSLPGISYTGAFDMLRLAIVIAPLIFAVFLHLSRESFLSISASVLAALAFVTFFFSGRDIVVGNASRFFYHAILVGFPLLLPLLIQLYRATIKELRHTAHTVPELVGGWIAVGSLILLVLLPAGGSVAGAHDNLMFKDEQSVDVSIREALWWTEDNTDPDAVFITSSQPPFAIPMFTGRSILRADFWLSPSDTTYDTVVAAYAGDVTAQQALIPHADYLLLTKEEQLVWESTLLDLTEVFSSGGAAIYATN